MSWGVPLGLPANSMWATAKIVEVHSGAPAGSAATAVATCPAGKKVIGAGGRSAGKPDWVMDTMDVAGNLSSVYVETMTTEFATGIAPVAVAYAICINPVPGQQRVGAATAFDSNDKTLTVSCPAGTRVHGTGGGITGALGQAYLDALLPSGGAPGGTHINAREDANGFARNWMVNAYAVCAN
jgi:hypothetical protein